MKIIVSALLSLSLLAGLAGSPAPASAEPYRKAYYKKRHAHHHTMGYQRYGYRPDYYEHIADKLPFGSTIWWEQMVREGRVCR